MISSISSRSVFRITATKASQSMSSLLLLRRFEAANLSPTLLSRNHCTTKIQQRGEQLPYHQNAAPSRLSFKSDTNYKRATVLIRRSSLSNMTRKSFLSSRSCRRRAILDPKKNSYKQPGKDGSETEDDISQERSPLSWWVCSVVSWA
jgi:hypothetical protein